MCKRGDKGKQEKKNRGSQMPRENGKSFVDFASRSLTFLKGCGVWGGAPRPCRRGKVPGGDRSDPTEPAGETPSITKNISG